MSAIRNYIQTHLLEPLKLYPTAIQDTMIELITQRLEELYNYSIRFPEIVSPNKSRLDILKTIAEQFSFTIREEADIQEQVDILENILYVYNRRGSLDTIENMWKYYGGDLPKDVKVIIPSYNLFRYSISALSGTHQFIKGKSQEGERRDLSVNSPGVYEIRLTNNTYPIEDLREFLLKELVAAGNEIYFTNVIGMDISQENQDTNPYEYNVYEDTGLYLQLEVLAAHQRGLTLSNHSYNILNGIGESTYWSGSHSIYLELLHILEIGVINAMTFIPMYIELAKFFNNTVKYPYKLKKMQQIWKEYYSYCTPADSMMYVDGYLYNREGEIIEPYQHMFVLGRTLLGTEY